MNSQIKAHVIIPTHSAHDTLAYAVLSAINQSLRPYRLTIIGDGATDEVRRIGHEMAKEFAEVEFLDNPKLKNRGENYRDEVIKASEADFISYLCDDDLFMPNHLEVMSQHLHDFDFVHPRPTFVNPDGTFFFLPSGIEIPKIKAWHRLDPPQNTISLTGASHTRQSYLSLEKGWDAGPPEYWTDLYMWVKFFSNPKVTTFTSPHTTTVKIMYSKEERDDLSRNDLIENWYITTRTPDQLEAFQRSLETQLKETLFNNSVELGKLNTVTDERDALTDERDALTAERDALKAERDHVLSSNSWKITKPFRKMRQLLENPKTNLNPVNPRAD